MNTGVVYFNTGTKCLARLAVGLFSLRDVYSGPVAVINEDGDGAEICQDICRAFDVQYVKMSSTVPDRMKNLNSATGIDVSPLVISYILLSFANQVKITSTHNSAQKL